MILSYWDSGTNWETVLAGTPKLGMQHLGAEKVLSVSRQSLPTGRHAIWFITKTIKRRHNMDKQVTSLGCWECGSTMKRLVCREEIKYVCPNCGHTHIIPIKREGGKLVYRKEVKQQHTK